MEWKSQPEDYDYQQELARAAFADMLHDSERNKMYYEGLKAAIALKRSQGQPVHVLDIGTGTGLLSMMAAKIGADSITAIEEFLPMANRAEKIIRDNGFQGQIKLVRKRSTSVQVGPGLDMDERANILVTEVFDTELIGEGAISTFNHAHDYLLTEDCLVIPHSGRVFAQVVSSDLCSKWNGLHDIGQDFIKVPEEHRGSGAKTLALHDLQLSQMSQMDAKKGHFKALSDPIPIFNFDFGRLTKQAVPSRRQAVSKFALKTKLKCDAIFMWWDLTFDPQSQIVLSCAPDWAKDGDIKQMAWRDHWMQAIYYPISSPAPAEHMYLISNHDEYSYWFDVSVAKPNEIPVAMPDPQPGIHLAVSRTRLGQLNDQEYNAKLTNAVRSIIAKQDSESNSNSKELKVFVLSEQSLLPLIVAKLLNKKGKVICFELNEQFRHVLNGVSKENDLKDTLEIRKDIENYCDITAEVIKEDIDVIFAEPSFGISLLPWHNLFYWYMLKTIKTASTKVIMSKKAIIWGCPVTFDHLWKIRAPLNIVEGFDLSHFDEVIMNACNISDAEVEPEPLWEYPCRAEAEPKPIMTFDLTQDIEVQNSIAKFANLNLKKRGSGMVFWMQWFLTEEDIVNTGPVKDVIIGQHIDWNMHHKQGVHFFVEKSEDVKINDVEVEVKFKQGELAFNFSVL